MQEQKYKRNNYKIKRKERDEIDEKKEMKKGRIVCFNELNVQLD